MKKILQIKLKEPLLIRDLRGVGNVLRSKNYIPGQTLRGALAHLYLKNNGAPNDPDFRDFFLNGKVQFGSALPGSSRASKFSRVIPATARECKYYPGFSDQSSKVDKPHGIQDVLFPWAAYITNLVDEFPEEFEKCQHKFAHVNNQECKAPLEPVAGFYEIGSHQIPEKIEFKKRLVQKTAINEFTQTAASGQLYSIEYLETGTQFSSIIEINKDIADRFSDFVQSHPRLRIGGKKNVGSGTAEIALMDYQDFPYSKSIEVRLQKLNQKFTEFIQKHSSNVSNDVPYLLSVTLDTDMILLDELLRHKNYINIHDLKAASNSSQADILNQFELIHAWILTENISGWNAAPGVKLPRRNELAVKMGSVFLFSSSTEPDLTQLVPTLEEIEKNCIGERTTEGFGRIRFCDEFHWQGPF